MICSSPSSEKPYAKKGFPSPFWEYENQTNAQNGWNGPHNFNFPVNVGDSIYVEVDSNLNNDGNNTFSVENQTHTSDYGISTATPYFSDSATAECIGEVFGSYLANFGTERINSCWVGTNSTSNFMNYWSSRKTYTPAFQWHAAHDRRITR